MKILLMFPLTNYFQKDYLEHFKLHMNSVIFQYLENLMMVPADQSGENLINNFLKPNLIKTEEQKVKEKAKEVVEFLNLESFN